MAKDRVLSSNSQEDGVLWDLNIAKEGKAQETRATGFGGRTEYGISKGGWILIEKNK